jgi:hypothetical protein
MTPKKPTTMLIEANFDIDQIGQTLEWKFSRKDGNGNPVKGRYAGGVYFTVGELTRVKVTAGGYSQFTNFKVLDCTLITLPQIVEIGKGLQTRFAPPSPFVSTPAIAITGASVSLPPNQFMPSTVQTPEPEYNQLALEWNRELTVGPVTGRWEISFVLTVEFTRDDGTTEQRAFSFDPEGEVGTGVTPPKMQPQGIFRSAPMAMLMPEGEVGTGVTPPK